MVVANICCLGHPSGLADLLPQLLGVLLAEIPPQSNRLWISVAKEDCHAQGQDPFPGAHIQ